MMTKRKKRMGQVFWVGTVFCLISLLSTTPSLAQKTPKGEVVVIVPYTFSMNGGDPHTSSGAGSQPVGTAIHDGLVIKGQDGSILPAVAKSWEVSKDGLSINFTLNERARFHNGEPVTAKDVKFSIERSMRPELKFFRGSPLKKAFDRIDVTDDYHLTVHFKSPYPAIFEWSALHIGIIPKAYVEGVGDAEFARRPIGAGPFRWVDGQQDIFVRAEAVEGHYRKTPSVKTIQFKFMTEPTTTMAMFKAGEADIVQIPNESLPEVQNDPKYRITWSKKVFAPSLLFCDLAFPNEPSPFQDVRVRRAASYAINRKAICEKLLHGAAEPWGDILAPYQPGFDPNIKPTPYDPEKAKALLKEAGYPNGFDTTFTYGFLGDKIEVQAMAADLARIGIRAKLVELEFGTFINHFREKKFHGLTRSPQPSWQGISHPGVCLESQSSESYWSYYSTPKIDAAFSKLAKITDEKAIGAQAREFSRVWHEAETRYMLWAFNVPLGLSPKIKTYKLVPGMRFMIGFEFLDLN
jgi:peptide/nickel transport system substrate-binding protein